MAELTTVADDEAVIHDGAEARTYRDLEPDTDHEIEGFEFRTLPRLGERLATVTTVNDVHFGETDLRDHGRHPRRPVLQRRAKAPSRTPS